MVRTGRMTVYKLDAMENGGRYKANSKAVPRRSKSRTRVPTAQILQHLGSVVAVLLEFKPYLEGDHGNRSLQTDRVRSRCSTWNSEQFRGDALPQGVRLPVDPMLFEIHGWLTNQSFAENHN